MDDLDSQLELSVLSGAIGSAARTLDEAGVDVARSIMDGNDFDDMVSRAAAKVGMTQDAAREVLQQAISIGVSEIAHQSLTRTDGIAVAGNQAAAAGDYAAAAAADASARAQAAADRAAEAAALEATGLTEEAAKVAELAQAEAELAAEAAEYATQVAAQEAQAVAEKAAVEAHHAAVEATAAAESAAAKASFIRTGDVRRRDAGPSRTAGYRRRVLIKAGLPAEKLVNPGVTQGRFKSAWQRRCPKTACTLKHKKGRRAKPTSQVRLRSRSDLWPVTWPSPVT